jgi:signal transduction histidine kinase
MTALRVLHIEDRRENRLLVRKLLEAQGIAVTDACDGLEGVAVADAAAPDLILVDINLPGLDGYEVVTKLKGLPSLAVVPIVAVTAEGDRSRALALGFDGFLLKPIQATTFVETLRGFLRGERERIPEDERASHLEAHNRRTVDRLEAKVRELTAANERLREVDRLKMEVLRNVSHELATPMTPLQGYLRMLSNGDLGPLVDGQRRALAAMDGALVRLNGQIRNLLEATRFATGNVTLDHRPFLPDAVAQAAIVAAGPLASARGVRIERVAGGGDPVLADEDKVREALRHVIENAVKFGPEGGTVRVEVSTIGTTSEPQVEFAVLDEGPGIPADQRERVVQPFYQMDGSVTRAQGGAGLGLAIADRTARLHGGLLLIGQAPGRGARICLRVPVRPPAV